MILTIEECNQTLTVISLKNAVGLNMFDLLITHVHRLLQTRLNIDLHLKIAICIELCNIYIYIWATFSEKLRRQVLAFIH